MSIFPLQMTPDLIKSLKAFTARSSERDAINDEARIAAIEHAIDLVLKGLKNEKRGLIERIKRIVLRPERAPHDTAPAAGSQDPPFAQAEKRIRSLDRQMRMFERVKLIVGAGRSLADSPPAAPASRAAATGQARK